tara:strand:+ start:23 stop:517 length:495 start_codon:yes stop_codon:yes gene_type:complete
MVELHSAEEIGELRTWALEQLPSEETELVDGNEVSYFVGPRNLGKDMGFESDLYVRRMFGKTEEDGYCFIVSEGWDEDLRKHIAYAEFIENISYHSSVGENNILHSMEVAVKSVPEDRRDRFIELARKLYDYELEWSRENNQDLDIQDLENTLEFLRGCGTSSN